MGGFIGGGAPKAAGPDPAVVAARAEAEAKAKAEQDAIEAKRREEEDALRRGLRGRKALLASGGELGFPAVLGAG